MDLNILTDGKNHMLGVYNIEPFAGEIRLKLNFLKATQNALMVDWWTGEQLPANEMLTINVPGKDIRFFLIGGDEFTRVPETKLLPASPDSGYGAYPVPGLAVSPLPSHRKIKGAQGKTSVGIFKITPRKQLGQWGEKAVHKKLSELPGFKVDYIESLLPDDLYKHNIVVVPNIHTGGVGNLDPKWADHLREYVENGGNVLLVHHSVGLKRQGNILVPEIGYGLKHVVVTDFKITDDNPLVQGDFLPAKLKNDQLKPGDKIDSGFPDFIVIKPGAESAIVASSVSGKELDNNLPAIVVGKRGEGRIVLCGINLGCKLTKVDNKWQGEEELTPGEEKVLVNAMYWLGQNRK